ncbi:GNAT family N-acetyltransferase [Shimia marina]|uniref:N-acetyltransferase domain-containing protein n=1 Tax=Shimia marina TaxID=321267 RepID=A0A0N7LS24_9RHOB|nr:GNAT family N-acetyltransferase [Shimia marina]CUH52428.1 hypothetical protein SHM7688_01874 [Shimia marina]SFE11483.1 Protein N-acetyltransferase, RimJ/RimL family [Shimia marina]
MTIAPTISTARLTLRQPEAGDFPAYAGYCASDRARFVGGPFDAVKAFEKLAAMAGHWVLRGFGRYIIEHKGAPVGHVGPLALESGQDPEMTWTLWNETSEGKGIAKEASAAVLDHLLQDAQWAGLISRVDAQNTPSRRLAESLGATLTDEAAPSWMPTAVTYRFLKVGV